MSKYCNCKSSNCPGPNCPSGGGGGGGGGDSLGMEALSITNSPCGKGYCGVADYGDEIQRIGSAHPDKLIFVVEWYDNGADLIKKYVLIYYMVDGTCEVKDVINHQRFLRRLKLETVTLAHLFVGNVINVFGRQMTVAEYADSCTVQYLGSKLERGFILIKPDGVPCLGRILEVIGKKFQVLRARMAQLTPDIAAQLFYEYNSLEIFQRLIDHVTSGPVVGFIVVGDNAVESIRSLVGEQDPGVAKLKHPSSLRAIYGKDVIMNALHMSETPGCVSRDCNLFFTECRLNLRILAPQSAIGRCSTCCIIKPHAVKDGLAGPIIENIARANYKITAFELFYLDRTHAEEFYEIYKGVLPEYATMTAELSIGPCYVMEISGCGENTANSFREFTGPMDPTLARKLRPNSLRAKYGKTKVENAVHCTDLCEDAEMEVDYFFRILQMV